MRFANTKYNRRRLLVTGGAILAGAAIASPIALRKMNRLPSPYVLASNNKTQHPIQSNGIPAHSTGDFPNSSGPFAISAQTHAFTIRRDPVANASLTPIVQDGFWNFGVALNGVPFDPAGPFWMGDLATGWQFEVMSTQARPFLGLDQGRASPIGITPEFPQGTYYYVLTDAYPFIPRLFRGTPDRSFRHSRGPGLGEVPPPLRNFPETV